MESLCEQVADNAKDLADVESRHSGFLPPTRAMQAVTTLATSALMTSTDLGELIQKEHSYKSTAAKTDYVVLRQNRQRSRHRVYATWS